jgi:hypothetical protein
MEGVVDDSVVVLVVVGVGVLFVGVVVSRVWVVLLVGSSSAFGLGFVGNVSSRDSVVVIVVVDVVVPNVVWLLVWATVPAAV